MNNTTAATRKTITVRGCNWTLAIGEIVTNASRRNGWTGRVVRHLGTKHSIRSGGTDGGMKRDRAQRVVIEIA